MRTATESTRHNQHLRSIKAPTARTGDKAYAETARQHPPPFKQQGPQPSYPPHGGGDELIGFDIDVKFPKLNKSSFTAGGSGHSPDESAGRQAMASAEG